MNEKEWKKISKAFFTKPKVQSSEEFVENVMAKINHPAHAPVRLGWPRWMTPAATLAVLTIFFFTGNLAKEYQPTTENLLEACSEGNNATFSGACDEDPEVEDLVGLDLDMDHVTKWSRR